MAFNQWALLGPVWLMLYHFLARLLICCDAIGDNWHIYVLVCAATRLLGPYSEYLGAVRMLSLGMGVMMNMRGLSTTINRCFYVVGDTYVETRNGKYVMLILGIMVMMLAVGFRRHSVFIVLLGLAIVAMSLA